MTASVKTPIQCNSILTLLRMALLIHILKHVINDVVKAISI